MTCSHSNNMLKMCSIDISGWPRVVTNVVPFGDMSTVYEHGRAENFGR